LGARVAIIFNADCPSRYRSLGEEQAVLGVLEAVRAVGGALSALGYPVRQVPLAPPLEEVEATLRRLETDVVFNLFEGFSGNPETEAEVADMMSALGLAYTGCPGAALRLSLDKAGSKKLLQANGIRTPVFQVLSEGSVSGFNLGFPCIVKPQGEDASHGISSESVVDSPAGLRGQVARVSRHYGGTALVEEFLDGREFNATVLGNSEMLALPVSEVEYALPSGAPRILTYSAKWQPDSRYFGGTVPSCPAHVTEEEREDIGALAIRACRMLGCQGYARVDMRTDAGGNLNVLEVNPNPDVSPGSGAARQAAAAGMTYAGLIDRITRLALGRDAA